jgi:integrase
MARGQNGRIHLRTRNGNLQVRFSFCGEQLQLGLRMPDNEINRAAAEGIAARINLDITLGKFAKSKLSAYLPQSNISEPQQSRSTLSLWHGYTDHRRKQGTSEITLNTHYSAIAANLSRFGEEIITPADAQLFVRRSLRPRQSNRTLNSNQKMLRGFGKWLVKQGHRTIDPFDDLAPVRAGLDRTKRQPFTTKEIQRILKAAKDTTTCPGYREFIQTLLFLGLRPSEAIGLRWKDVDLDRKQVSITSVLARSPEGRSAGSARIRKGLKTGESGNRVLDLVPDMVSMFRGHKPNHAKPTDLVFSGPRGKPIDDHAFSQRCWRRILTEAEVRHRPPYCCRHTTISHLIEMGATLPQAAQVAGHVNTEQISRTYGHMIDRPEMPSWGLH